MTDMTKVRVTDDAGAHVEIDCAVAWRCLWRGMVEQGDRASSARTVGTYNINDIKEYEGWLKQRGMPWT